MNVKNLKRQLVNIWMWFVAIVATMFIACSILLGIGSVVLGMISWLR